MARMQGLTRQLSTYSPEIRAEVCIGYGLVTTFTDPNAFTVSREMFVTAQTLCTAIDDWVGLVYSTIWLGYNAWFHGNIAYALQIFEASVGQAQSIHDRRRMGLLWCHIGFIRAVEGDAVPEQLAKIRLATIFCGRCRIVPVSSTVFICC